MKSKSFIFFLLFITSTFASAQDKYLVTWDYKGLGFNDFVLKCETSFPVRFFYNEAWIKDISLGQYKGIPYLTDVLDSLFNGTSIHYFIDDSHNVVLTKDFVVRLANQTNEGKQNYMPGNDYLTSSEASDNIENSEVEIGDPVNKNISGNAIISGYIRNLETKEAISGATIFIPKLSIGTISNEFGFYSLTLPKGRSTVKYMFIGMKERIIDINVYGSGEMNVEMRSTLVPLKETVITADKNVTLQRFEVGVEKINIISFRLMPTSMGESDIIKSILLVPGVQSVGEGSAGFNVRGGSADQNLILLYGAPVYNPSHFFGFFSAVNSDIIKDVNLYKGGIPSRYGGRISSVLDISSRDGNKREFLGNAGISPITTHFVIEGPIKKDTCSYLFAGRTTYSNWIFGLIESPTLKNSRASFYDFNARIAYDIDKKNKIDLSTYFSHDSFKFNSDTTYQYDNNIVALRWRHFFSSRFFSSLTLNNSFNKYDISSLEVPQESFVLSHKINSTSLKGDINWYLVNGNELNMGFDLTRYDVLPGSLSPIGDSSIVTQGIVSRQRGFESAIYIEDKLNITHYMSVSAGLRFSSFFAFGPKTVFIYNPAFTKSIFSLTDTLNFGTMERYKTYAGPEFRMSVNFKLNDKSSLKLNYNRTRQYLHLLSNTTSISPTDTWELCDYYLKPQIGDQIGTGFYRMLNKKKIEASAELYYKVIQNMVDFKGGTGLIMNHNIERDMVYVQGKAYGTELMLKKPEGKFRWSIGYTYSRILIRSISQFSEERINSGKWFPANFDKPHDLNLTLNYLLSRRFSFSANYTYSSGRPVTYPVATYNINDLFLTYYSDRNKYRIPDYSRLDLSIKISGNLKAKKIARPNWTFSVYNLLGRQNVYSIYFKKQNNMVNGYKLSVFGRPIPSITFNFDF